MENFFRNIFPEKLNNPDRFACVEERHMKAFKWEKQGWIPLGLIVNDPKHSEGINYEQWLQPEIFLELQSKMLRDTLDVGSDITPSIALNHMDNALYPSIFDAKITINQTKISAIQEIGPWIFPLFENIEDVDNVSVPAMPYGLICDAERFMEFYQSNLPEWVQVVSPDKIGPFSLAELLRGSSFYLDLIVDPERSRHLLELCAISLIESEQYLRNVVNQRSEEFYSQFGIRGLGLRIGDDSIINISPDMIKEFVVPSIRQIAEAFGGLIYVHFCTIEKACSEHVYNALADANCIFAASSQFGFEYYENNLNNLKNRLAIESLYGDGITYPE